MEICLFAPKDHITKRVRAIGKRERYASRYGPIFKNKKCKNKGFKESNLQEENFDE